LIRFGPRSDGLKTTLRIGGICLLLLGVSFLPFKDYVFSEGDLSVFNLWSQTGAFARYGLGLAAVGAVVFALSFLVRGELTD
jgi:hypothetical protein